MFNKSRVNISQKLIIPVIVTVLVGSIISTYLASSQMKQLATNTINISLKQLSESIFLTLRESMNSADPIIIKKAEKNIVSTLKTQGLKDLKVFKSQKLIDLYSPNESLTTNTIVLDVMKNKKEKIITMQKEIKLYKPFIATQECLMCHNTHNVGEAIGVVEIDYSLDYINKAVNKTNWYLIITAIIILILTIVVMQIFIKNAINPLEIFSKELKIFFDYLNGKKNI